MKKFFDAKFAETLKIDKKRQPQLVEVCIYIYIFFSNIVSLQHRK